MTWAQKVLILWLLATGFATIIAIGSRLRASNDSQTTPKLRRLVPLSTVVVLAGLVIVGIVSNLLPTHLVQVAPLVIVLLIYFFSPRSGVIAALAVLSFWFVAMGAIWLFLLGIAHLLSGKFPPIEIALTLVIGVGALVGVIGCFMAKSEGIVRALITIIPLAGLQAFAVWLSYQPIIRGR